MLYEEGMPPKPKSLKVTHDFGEISIIARDKNGDADGIVTGRHIIVEGMARDFCGWLGGREVWIGEGQPMEQRFIKRLIGEVPNEK